MKRKISGLMLGLVLAAGVAQAVDWSTNLPCFLGGGYDGWDRQAMSVVAGLGGARVSLSSGADQELDWTQAQAALATATIQVVQATNELGQTVITNGSSLRLSVPSAWACRFETGAALSFDGDAKDKVNGAGASYTGDGRTLIVPVTEDFGDGDTLTVAGLKLLDLALCRAGAEKLELDIDGDGGPDANDAYALRLSVQHRGGFHDGWDRQALPALAGLGGAEVSFSSVTNQALLWTQAQAALTTATIRVVDQGTPISITNGGTIRVSVPDAWACRFDTSAVVSFASNAAARVSASVSYVNGGRTLVISVTDDFLTGDTLAIDGLRLLDLALCAAGSQKLQLDFDGDGLTDLSDACTLDLSVPHFGGFYDGWDQMAMTSVSGLGGGEVSFSSGSNQAFLWTQVRGALATVTITATDPAGTMTNGGTIRVSVPTAWACRFDAGASPSFTGNAADKVNAAGASYTDGGRTLVVPVLTEFEAGDALGIGGLKLLDLALCPAGSQKLELDFDGDGLSDVSDTYTLDLSVPHPGGGYDGWDRGAPSVYQFIWPQGGSLFMFR